MKTPLFTLVVFLFSFSLYAQKKALKPQKSIIEPVQENRYEEIDKQVSLIPDSLSVSTDRLSGYINDNFHTDEHKVRAVYIWLAKNISYDVDSMFTFNFNETSQNLINKAIKNKKAICAGYAALFSDISNKVGIKSYVITGYTKQGSTIANLSHAWNVALVNGKWYMFDTTWGAGNVSNGKFVRDVNDVFFMVDPTEFIYTHMPFDPMWQFSDYPITNKDFYENKLKQDASKIYFNMKDSLSFYESQSDLKKLELSEKRAEKNGIVNSMIYDYLRNIKADKFNAVAIKHNIAIEKYNKAVDQCGVAIKAINDFITYRNNRFTPQKSDQDIEKMLSNAEIELDSTKKILLELPEDDKEIKNNSVSLKSTIRDIEKNITDQKIFLQKYFKVWKPMRKVRVQF